MKYRPSKSFVYLMVTFCPITVALIFGLLPELPGMAARPIPGEITFSSEKPTSPITTTAPARGSSSSQRSMEWFEEGYENLMKWKYNPWKSNKQDDFGCHYMKVFKSDAPADQAYCREMERRVEAWYQKLLLRYPEMAVTMKTVPDDQNGFLKWLELSERLKKENGGHDVQSLSLPKELDQYLSHEGAWNAEAAKTWLAQQKALVDEIRAIGLMPEASVNGIAVDRWGFIPARLARDCAQSLMLEARLAAEQGDTAAAFLSIQAAKGLADHFTEVETPTLLGVTVQIILQLSLEKFTLTQILPILPAGQLDPTAWKQVLNPIVSPPSEFARYMKGEWSVTTRQYVLPMLLDAEDPDVITDGGDFLDAYVAPFVDIVRTHDGAAITDLPNLDSFRVGDLSHLSRNGRKLGEILSIGARAWRKGWERSQSASAMTQAAFAIMKGQPIPQDPIYRQDYRWDPVTRQLSMPAGKNFDDMGIKPITVPKP
ncbi:MAG: hypothetical protein ABI162_16640 [Luteolibacter sp.]